MNAAVQEQTAPAAVEQQPKVSVFDDIVENTSARKQAEQAKADLLMGRTYGPGLGIAPELAALKIAYGRDFGFLPAQSLKFIHVINGVPSLESSGRTNLLVKAGYSWKPVKHDDTTAHFQFYRHGEVMTDAADKPLTVQFSMKDAERAGYVVASRGKSDKGNYDKVPMNMLFARCLANFHRWHAPEVDGAMMADPGEILDRAIEATQMRMPEEIKQEVVQNAVAG